MFHSSQIPRQIGLIVVLQFLLGVPTCGTCLARGSFRRQDSNETYLLDTNDQITVIVRNHPEFSGDFYVPQGGIVIFPVVGALRVAGTSLQQLSKSLTEMYSGELKAPNITVILKTPRLQQISVVGDVVRPGPEPLVAGYTLLSAINAAGGLPVGTRPSDCTVILRRKGNLTTLKMDMITTGRVDSDLPLKDGDIITVDAGAFPVYIVGQVRSPGVHLLRRGDDLLKALAEAGGTPDTGAISKIRITSLSGEDQVVNLVPALVEGEKPNLPLLKRGDLVTVPQLTSQFLVLGYVGSPGAFPIPEGETITLATAVSMAKGHDTDHKALWSSVYLTRTESGKTVQRTYNLGRYLKGGKVDQNPIIKPGDIIYVPASGQVPASAILAGLANLGAIYFYVK